MAKLPSFQFYPGDWMKDPNLRRCSHAAKGVWIDMMCLMHECDERGVLATAGRAWSEDEIASAVGGDQQATLACIRELVEKQVARRRGAGAIYSARMTRDEAIRKARALAGKEGGKQKASKSLANTLAKRGSSVSSSSSDLGLTPPTPSSPLDESSQARKEQAAFFGGDDGPLAAAMDRWKSPGSRPTSWLPEAHAVAEKTVGEEAMAALFDAETNKPPGEKRLRFSAIMAKAKTLAGREGFVAAGGGSNVSESKTRVKANEAKYARFHK